MPKANRLPKYRRHTTGQAYVGLNGQAVYLGKHGTAASRQAYDRTIAEWLANGRQTPRELLTITELIAGFWEHAEKHYVRPDGTPSTELQNFRACLRILKRLYGPTPAVEFGPLALAAVRGEMIKEGWARESINKQITRVRKVFKWGVATEKVPQIVRDSLTALDGLAANKTEARETEPVRPVPIAHVDAVLPHVSDQVAAMIRLQLPTGMRPAEVCIMRTCDIDTAGAIWIYKPAEHKTKHRGHDRTVRIGPRAQELLRSFLKPDLEAFMFSPSEAEAARRAKRTAQRVTPTGYGNAPGTNKRRRPQRAASDRYSVASYRRAIARACEKAFAMPAELRDQAEDTAGQKRDRAAKRSTWREQHVWHPHQLRHTRATEIRRDHGLEAATVILGHRHTSVTEIYAEKNAALAEQVMGKIG